MKDEFMKCVSLKTWAEICNVDPTTLRDNIKRLQELEIEN